MMDWQFCVSACSHKINNDNENSKYFKEPGFNSVDFALEVHQLKDDIIIKEVKVITDTEKRITSIFSALTVWLSL